MLVIKSIIGKAYAYNSLLIDIPIEKQLFLAAYGKMVICWEELIFFMIY